MPHARRALIEQFWDATGAGRADGEAPANVTLLDGTYAGPGNRALELHGVPLAIRSLRGPERVRIDCSPGQMRWATLFDRGEGGGVTVRLVTLRKDARRGVARTARLATHAPRALRGECVGAVLLVSVWRTQASRRSPRGGPIGAPARPTWGMCRVSGCDAAPEICFTRPGRPSCRLRELCWRAVSHLRAGRA